MSSITFVSKSPVAADHLSPGDILMFRQKFMLSLAAGLLVMFSGLVQAAEPKPRTWTIEGVSREAIIAVPDAAKQTASPLVFVFHGHGGNMRQVARSFRIHELWDEAIVVYMQGLNTPGQLTDPEGKRPGWQKEKGDQMDRDLKFFDEVLKSLKQDYKVDEKRIFSTGHSNGGGFTYLLWSERPDVFAAFAPSGSAALRLKNTLKPKPMLHIAGDNDPLVKYAWQTMMIDSVKKTNQCEEGQPWEEKCTQFPSKIGAPVITFVTSQGHKFPPEAPALIVKFFKQY
jgi:polyhydroxybutyrate depolymerase